MSADNPVTQWQTVRVVTANDALITEFVPADLTAARRANQMIGVKPFYSILLRGFGQDANNEAAALRISGWMDPDKPNGSGPGQVLWSGDPALGNFSSGFTGPPITGPAWPSGTYFEVDLWNPDGGTSQIAPFSLDGTDKQSCVFLPTLGYSHLLFEVTLTSMLTFGLIWRGISTHWDVMHTVARGS